MYNKTKSTQQTPAYRAFPRKLLATSTALLAGVPMLCSALGLGEMQYQSYLGQPLKAEIDLVNLPADIDKSHLKIRQVERREAGQLGVEILSSWHHFDFELAPGKSEYQLKLQSQRPINEPYLNFLIELAWPQGTLYREYTVFLDPAPTLAKSGATESPGRATIPAGKAPGNYRVSNGDTLYGIAKNLNTQNSTANTAQWLFENNPQAFIAGDMNRLVAGSELRLPVGSEMQFVSSKTNPRESAAREGRVILDAPLKVEGEMQLAQLKQTENGDVREQLHTNRAVLDYLVKENRDLKDRLDYLESSEYLSTLKQLVALQQNEIVQLREQLTASQPTSLLSNSEGSASGTLTTVKSRAEKLLEKHVQKPTTTRLNQDLAKTSIDTELKSRAETPIAKAGLSPALRLNEGLKNPISPFWTWFSGLFVFGAAFFAAFLVWRSRTVRPSPSFTATRDVEPSKPAFIYKDGREEISIDDFIDSQSNVEAASVDKASVEAAQIKNRPVAITGMQTLAQADTSEPRHVREIAEKVQQERARVADLQQRIKEKTSDYAQRKAERQQEPRQVEEIEIDPELEEYLKF